MTISDLLLFKFQGKTWLHLDRAHLAKADEPLLKLLCE